MDGVGQGRCDRGDMSNWGWRHSKGIENWDGKDGLAMNAIYALRTYTENKSMTRLLMLNLETYLSINCNFGNKSKGNLLQCN